MNQTKAECPPRIVVVGSVNIDLVVRSPRLPAPGETVIGRQIEYIPGGKGANQAVAAARLGASVAMIGRVGDDQFGALLRDNLQKEQVRVDTVATTTDCVSGLAIVAVDDCAENCITVIPGANGRLTPEDIYASESVIRQANAMLVQMEIPAETVVAALRVARDHKVTTVLDPAPAPSSLADGILDVDFTCPNEWEAEALTGIKVASDEDAHAAACRLRELGAAQAVVTLGRRGAMYCDRDGRSLLVPSPPVTAVDSTAAGDAFAACLAVSLAEGMACRETVRRACAAGAFAASRPGAQPAMPHREDLVPLLAAMC